MCSGPKGKEPKIKIKRHHGINDHTRLPIDLTYTHIHIAHWTNSKIERRDEREHTKEWRKNILFLGICTVNDVLLPSALHHLIYALTDIIKYRKSGDNRMWGEDQKKKNYQKRKLYIICCVCCCVLDVVVVTNEKKNFFFDRRRRRRKRHNIVYLLHHLAP